MRASNVVSIDLSADDLLSPLPSAPAKAEPAAEQDTVEIELTAELLAAVTGLPLTDCPDTGANRPNGPTSGEPETDFPDTLEYV